MVDTPTEDQNASEVLTRAVQGDMDAFCALVSMLESRLLGQAFALCGDLTVAEDLAQQTWIEAWKSRSRYNHSCRFTTWLYSILLHVHSHHLRQKRSRPIPLAFLPQAQSEQSAEALLEMPSAAPSPHEVLLQKESAEKWRRLTELLPDIHRNVILLRFFEDATLEEIAIVTGASINTVKTRLHYALKKLRSIQDQMNFSNPERHT